MIVEYVGFSDEIKLMASLQTKARAPVRVRRCIL